jgi:poly(3-hydroxybutyrate) depolymerase
MRLCSRLQIAAIAVLFGCRREADTTQPGRSEAAPPTAAAGTASPVPTVAATDAPGASSADRSPTTPPAKPPLPALKGQATVALPVPGFRDAVVSLPLGTTTKRPIVLALHGNFDRPEWQCDVWRGIIGERAFVLCPRGIPRRDVPQNLDRWEYGSQKATQQELAAAVAALQARYAEYVAEGSVLFTGFSLGAILGARIVQAEPLKYPQAVLIEGGEKGWTLGAARKFAEGGGRRVLFVCAQAGCTNRTKSAVRSLERAGVEARVASAGNVGHTYGGEVSKVIVENWDWVTAGDDRFEKLAATAE